MFRAGKLSGSGILGRGAPLLAGDGCEASYEGGGSNGVFSSGMLLVTLQNWMFTINDWKDEVKGERGKARLT